MEKLNIIESIIWAPLRKGEINVIIQDNNNEKIYASGKKSEVIKTTFYNENKNKDIQSMYTIDGDLIINL